MTSRKLLVVTGDYGVVQQVKQSLGGRDFAVHTAYSHLDAVYQLSYEAFELVLVDSAMTNRKTGEHTASALAEMEKHPPLLIYAPTNGVLAYSGTPPFSGRWASDGAVTSLEEDSLWHAVAGILRLPAPADESTTADEKPSKSGLANTSIFWRDEEMQTLFSLGRSLTEVLDLSEVLNRVVEAARRLTNAEEGMILLPDGQSGQLYLRAKVGIDLEVADNFRIKTHDTIAGTVFESGQPILVGERGPQKVKTEYFVKSLLYVPIIHKGQTLGVLGVNNKEKPDIFNERHRDLLINLASYAAVAIENARIHGQSVRRTHELKTLIDASQAINASLLFDHTLSTICQQLIRVLNVGHAEIHSWDSETLKLRLLARCQQAIWHDNHAPLIPLAERPVTRMALENRRYVYVQRDRPEISVEHGRLKQVGANAMLVIPILGGDQVLGTAQLYYVDPPLLGLASESIYRTQHTLLEGWARAVRGKDQATFLTVLDDAKMTLDADWIEFTEVEQDSGALKLVYASGTGVWIDEPRPVMDVNVYPDLYEALQSQQPLNHFEGEDNLASGARALFKNTHSRSLLTLPLIGRGQTLGLVVFGDAQHARGFSTREIDLGRAIVGQAATALENVGLVHDLEISLRELREAQSRLVQGARLSAMGELAAAVAHQINNPLTTIVLDTELLMENEAVDTKNYEVLSAISRAGKRAAGVVRRLLAMARPISSDTPRAPIDVIDTIKDIAALVRPHIEREGIELTMQFPEDAPPPVEAVPGELNDVWLNLILNAHDSVIGREMPEIGVISDYDEANAEMEVTVWDNGPGIPSEIIGEIFKPFFTTKPQGEGTGLGLHICRQVVDRVGGTITVQTSPSGTRFVVRLPIMRST